MRKRRVPSSQQFVLNWRRKIGASWNANQLQTLKEFLTKDFLPFTRTRFAGKVKTCDYYEYGADRLNASEMAHLRITEITGKHATQFAAQNSTLKASTINCGLRTLRRALNLAFEWVKLDKPVRVPLPDESSGRIDGS